VDSSLVTTDVENFPGFPEGISGPELIENMRKQAERFGTQFVMKDVTAVDLSVYPFRVTAEDTEYLAKSLIIATGARAKYLDHPSIEKFKGRGISACATCDGFFFRDSIVFVIGGGDTAAEEALFLARFAKEVTIVHRRDKLRTEKYVQEKLSKNPKIKIIWDSVVEDIQGSEEKGVEKIILKNLKQAWSQNIRQTAYSWVLAMRQPQKYSGASSRLMMRAILSAMTAQRPA
jgi:thioredoxin reductase (NADPH)